MLRRYKMLPIRKWRPSVLFFALLCSTWLSTLDVVAQTHPEIKGVKFSKKELELVKRLDQLQSGAGLAKTMLKAAPFVQIFSATSPDDIAVNIVFNDWDYIYGALTSLAKIQACKTFEAITVWRDIDGSEY